MPFSRPKDFVQSANVFLISHVKVTNHTLKCIALRLM